MGVKVVRVLGKKGEFCFNFRRRVKDRECWGESIYFSYYGEFFLILLVLILGDCFLSFYELIGIYIFGLGICLCLEIYRYFLFDV